VSSTTYLGAVERLGLHDSDGVTWNDTGLVTVHDRHKFISSRFRADVGARLGRGSKDRCETNPENIRAMRLDYGLYEE